MKYDRAGAWEEPEDWTKDFLENEKRARLFHDLHVEERDNTDVDENDLDYQDWLEMDYYSDGYTKNEAKKMAREQLLRERAWRESHTAD